MKNSLGDYNKGRCWADGKIIQYDHWHYPGPGCCTHGGRPQRLRHKPRSMQLKVSDREGFYF